MTTPATKGPKNYITPNGLQRLRDEHRFLLTRERPAVTQVVAWAAANGDRSENADYQYGKRRLREIDRRIRYLTQRLEASVVVIAPVVVVIGPVPVTRTPNRSWP